MRWVCVLAAVHAVEGSPECAVEAGAACLEAAAARHGARIEVADGAVPTVFLSDPQTPLRAFAACREPVVIKGSSVRDWRGISRWSDADALGAALPTLQGAYVRDEAADARELALSLSRSLAHDAGEGAARGVQLPPSDPPAETSGPRRQLADDPSGYEEEVMGIRDFFADAAERTLYYARWMGHTDLAPLRADAEPFDTLLLDDDGGKSAPHDERRYFRLGTAGCTSSLHYDEYHNAFVQLTGAKVFWLLPPASWAHTMSHPRGHDRYRQSPRPPVYTWTDEQRDEARARAVALRPADVLIIPPYWWHQTLTLERSAALNVWSPSAESRRAAALASLVPLESIFGPAESAERPKGAQLRHLAAFVRAVARALPTDASGADRSAGGGAGLLREIYATQHAHGRRRSPRRRASASAQQQQPTVETEVDAACPPFADDESPDPAKEVRSAAEAAAAGLRALPEGVRELALADYVDELAEHLQLSVPPAWPARGRGAVLACVLAGRKSSAGR